MPRVSPVVHGEHPLGGAPRPRVLGGGLGGGGAAGEGAQVEALVTSTAHRVRAVVPTHLALDIFPSISHLKVCPNSVFTATHLNDALEVDVHGVGELEGLEVGVADDGGGAAEVLDLLELAHDLGPGDAAELVHQLDGGALAVVRHAVADQHVELVLVILQPRQLGNVTQRTVELQTNLPEDDFTITTPLLCLLTMLGGRLE